MKLLFALELRTTSKNRCDIGDKNISCNGSRWIGRCGLAVQSLWASPYFIPELTLTTHHQSCKAQHSEQSGSEYTLCRQAGRARTDARNSWAECGFAPFLKLASWYSSSLEKSLCFFFFLSRINMYLHYTSKEKPLFFIIFYSCGTQWCASYSVSLCHWL